MTNKEVIEQLLTIKKLGCLTDKDRQALNFVIKALERPTGDLIGYKPLDADFNIQSAVKNLRTAYWSNEPEKVAKAFSEAEDIIISAICNHGYTVSKENADRWIPVSERLPEKEGVECLVTTDFGDVCEDKFVGGVFVLYRGSVIAWKPMPKMYKEN